MNNPVRIIIMWLLLSLAGCATALGDGASASDVMLTAKVNERHIDFALQLKAKTTDSGGRIRLLTGNLTLTQNPSLPAGAELSYDTKSKSYDLVLAKEMRVDLKLHFVARPKTVANGVLQTDFSFISQAVRRLEINGDKAELEVKLPKALRVQRSVSKDGKVTVTGLLGPRQDFIVQWRPQTLKMDAKLVFAAQTNTIVNVGTGVLTQNTIHDFKITQGTLNELRFAVPTDVSITEVKGSHIRDWRLSEENGTRELRVILNQAQKESYALQILSELPLNDLPLTTDIPVIVPKDVIRAAGTTAVGTDSTIQLVVRKTAGLSQVDSTGFPRRVLSKGDKRAIPSGKVFYYSFVSPTYKMQLELADIIPSYDVVQRLIMSVKEDDLAIDGELEVDIRDAGVRQLNVELDSRLLVSNVTGEAVDDYDTAEGKNGRQKLIVNLKKATLGRTTIKLRLELGKGPLGTEQKFGGLKVTGAKNERGYLVIVGDRGVKINEPKVTDLREVHTSSIPMRVANAQKAFRFRRPDWSMTLSPDKEAASVLTEGFHLTSLGEGTAYGSVAMNYLISGAPVDELYFTIPSTLKNVEFVGGDVLRWQQDGDQWTVKLRRRVQGEYNLGISYTQPYNEGDNLVVGGVQCRKVETHSGYVVVASNLNLELGKAGDADDGLLAIDADEVPANYRLLVNAPVLSCFKYVDAPHQVQHTARMYPWGASVPLLIEVTQLRTDVNVNENGETQSVTRIRYKVKNLNSQFLTLALPKDTTYLSTRLVQVIGHGQEKVTELRARVDEEKGSLMVPLRRFRDPNQPLTIELEYGIAHGDLPFNGAMQLIAPTSGAKATFSDWQVTTSGKWALFPKRRGNGMRAMPRNRARTSANPLVHFLVKAWTKGVERWYEMLGLPICGLFIVTALISMLVIRKRYAAYCFVACIAATLLWIGIAGVVELGGGTLGQGFGALQSLTYTQAATLGEGNGLLLEARIIPLWRSYASLPAIIVALVVGIGGAIGSVFVKGHLRKALWVLPATTLVWFITRFPHLVLIVMHLILWGAPAALVILMIVRVVGSLRSLKAPAAAALILVGMLFCVDVEAKGKPTTITEPLGAVACNLVAESDGMSVDIYLRLKQDQTLSIPVMRGTAVLMGVKPKDAGFGVERRGDTYYLTAARDWTSGKIQPAGKKGEANGTYDVHLQFLTPLNERQFRMSLPTAMTNRVSLVIPKAGQAIAAPSAVSLHSSETKGSSSATAVFAPGEDLSFQWKPRARQTSQEATVFYAEAASLIHFDAGLTEGRHRIGLQVAQGEVHQLGVTLPANMTVTAVDGKAVGGWRFDPKSRRLDVKFSEAITGEYSLTFKTQVASPKQGSEFAIGTIRVEGAASQREAVALASSGAVSLSPETKLKRLSIRDFARTATDRLVTNGKIDSIRYAYRVGSKAEALTVSAKQVLPELRVNETAVFTVADDRLVYNGSLEVEISKAGVFALSLSVPEGYDIDALAAKELSHWDDDKEDGKRQLRLHLKGKIKGQVKLMLTMSRPETSLPEKLSAPRVQVVNAVRHTGTLSLSTDQSVRLSIDKAKTKGVSLIPRIPGQIARKGQVDYKLLKPNWNLEIATEVVKPRVNVDFLHRASVTEGVVRHRHQLFYKFHNAGSKLIRFQAPKNAVGLQINGPEIARREEEKAGSGLWRIELERKWFNKSYPLSITYETRFDRAAGVVELLPLEALGVDAQRGYVTVHASERVELSTEKVGSTLQETEARQIPTLFGQRDLADAAFSFRSLSGVYDLTLRATRHGAAEQLDADVLSLDLITVVTRKGETLNQLRTRMLVNDRRYLAVQLPANAEAWSLWVNRRATRISRQADAGGVLLIPLQQGGASEMLVDVELIYVATTGGKWNVSSQEYALPKIDLPLKKLKWTFYLPEEFNYGDFEGSLRVADEEKQRPVIRYGLKTYEAKVKDYNRANLKLAEQFQEAGNRLAIEGRQTEAKRALLNACNYSVADPNLNEDARVQLHGLIRQQAIVGLVGRRSRLRNQRGGRSAQTSPAAMDLGDRFRPEDAQRIQSSLSKSDSENLEKITERIIEAQEAARGAGGQLTVQIPLRGKVVTFERPLQVKPNAQMTVRFDASRSAESNDYWNYLICLIGGVLITVAIARITKKNKAE